MKLPCLYNYNNCNLCSCWNYSVQSSGLNIQCEKTVTRCLNDTTEFVSSFPFCEFVRANGQKGRNGSYLFAANFFASQF